MLGAGQRQRRKGGARVGNPRPIEQSRREGFRLGVVEIPLEQIEHHVRLTLLQRGPQNGRIGPQLQRRDAKAFVGEDLHQILGRSDHGMLRGGVGMILRQERQVVQHQNRRLRHGTHP